MNIHHLQEQRTAKMAEAKALIDNAKGQLDETQQKRFDELDREIVGLDGQITRARKIADWERQAQATPVAGGRDTIEAETRKASLINFVRLGIPDFVSNEDLGREREIHQELTKRSGEKPKGIKVPTSIFQIEKRVITTDGSPLDGGNLVGTDHRGDLYVDLLRGKLVTAQRGATVLTGLVGNVDIPGGKGSATAAWIAEDAALTPSAPSFRKAIALRPKTVGALTELSRNILQQSSPEIERLIRADFAAAMAGAGDTGAINGSGGTEPTGILQQGIQSSDMTTPTYEKVLEMIEKIETANADQGALGFATHPSVVRKLRSTTKVADDAAAGFIMDGPGQLAGYALSSSTLIPYENSPPTSTLLFGNFADLVLGYWSTFEILVNPYESTAYSKGNVQVRGLLTMDAAVRHAESFVAAESVDVSLSG